MMGKCMKLSNSEAVKRGFLSRFVRDQGYNKIMRIFKFTRDKLYHVSYDLSGGIDLLHPALVNYYLNSKLTNIYGYVQMRKK